MSSEKYQGSDSYSLDPKQFLFHEGISLDGRIVVQSFPLEEEPPVMIDTMAAYRVLDRQHLTPNMERVIYESASLNENMTVYRFSGRQELTPGIDQSLNVRESFSEKLSNRLVFASITRNVRNQKVDKFSVTMKPLLSDDEKKQVFGNIQSQGVTENVQELFENLIPTCTIDTESISLENSNGRLLSYAGKGKVSMGESFADLFVQNRADIVRSETGSLQEVRMNVKNIRTMTVDNAKEAYRTTMRVDTGFRVNVDSFEQVQRLFRTIFEHKATMGTTLPRIVEPFVTITTRKQKAA